MGNHCLCVFRRKWVIGFASFVLTVAPACSKKVEGGQVIVRNDIRDKSYNVIQVSNVRVATGRKSYRVTLRPGQQSTIPYKHIRSLQFSRRYKDHTKVYQVQCPEGFNRQVTMKLIDVHMNRIGGGCSLVRRGEMRYGSIRWEK